MPKRNKTVSRVTVPSDVTQESIKTGRGIGCASGITEGRLIAESAVAVTSATCIGKCLETNSRTEADLLEAQRPAYKTVKCLITYSRVGTGNSVTLKGLPPNSNIGTQIEPINVAQSSARSVAEERSRANGRISSSSIEKKSERSITSVVGAVDVAQKRACTRCRILVRGIH
jgi:hypothetical protein